MTVKAPVINVDPIGRNLNPNDTWIHFVLQNTYNPMTYDGYIWTICSFTFLFVLITFITIRVYDYKNPRVTTNFVEDEEKLRINDPLIA